MTVKRLSISPGKTITLVFLVGSFLIASCFISGCISTVSNATSPGSGGTSTLPVERVEVYHFHLTQQCYSCKTVGAYAEETVKTHFPDELKSGKLVFAHINVQLPENRQLVEQYGPTGSSLWIGVYDRNGFHKEENSNVWYKINDKEAYMNYLGDLIRKRMDGDFT
jgi:hypothetical protein